MPLELSHGLDQHLASVGQAPCAIDADGNLMFMVGEYLQAYANRLPDGRLELFAGTGYVRAETLQALLEADEDDDFDESEPRHVADIVARWTGEGMQWAADVDRQTGLLTVSMFVADVPRVPEDWAVVLDAFKRTGASWVARLQRDAPDPLPYAGTGLVDSASGAFLRC